MLTKSGAKLLDFGLAKTRVPAIAGAGMSMLSTATNLTSQGAILGTFQYMAPEQLEGREADARTDIFSFGAMVYEMLTGRKAFEGTSQASLISAIMSADPPALSVSQPLMPPSLDHVVRRCLAKNPDDRWQTASDTMRELEWIEHGPSLSAGAPPVSAGRVRRERLTWLSIAGLLLLTALGLVAYFQRSSSHAPLVRMSVPAPQGVTSVGSISGSHQTEAWSSQRGRPTASSASISGDSTQWSRVRCHGRKKRCTPSGPRTAVPSRFSLTGS